MKLDVKMKRINYVLDWTEMGTGTAMEYKIAGTYITKLYLHFNFNFRELVYLFFLLRPLICLFSACFLKVTSIKFLFGCFSNGEKKKP